jgi:hypothetical protein
MKRSWVSLVIFVMLSMVNANPFYVYERDDLFRLHKRAVTFGPCIKASDVVLTVKTIDPDPLPGGKAPTTLTLTLAKEAVRGGFFLISTISEGDPKAPKILKDVVFDLCGPTSELKCPIPAGEVVNIGVKTSIPAYAKIPFNIEYSINDGVVTIACAIGIVGDAGGKAPAKEPTKEPVKEPVSATESDKPANNTLIISITGVIIGGLALIFLVALGFFLLKYTTIKRKDPEQLQHLDVL